MACTGDFAGSGPGCCADPDESTTSAMLDAVCVDGEWTCETDGESICSCADTTVLYDCVSSCDAGAAVSFPFCVYGDHWGCPSDMIRSDSCSEDVEPEPEPYACGWPSNDPGTLVSTGTEVGDVV